jgi:general secretion pathway protein D
LEAASLVRFANEARDAKRYQAALDLYSKALERDPGNADAKAGVANTQAILGLDTARPDFTTQYADRIRQRQEAIRFSFNSAMEEARLAREANKFDEARNALIKAQAVRDADPSIFAGSDISSFDAAIKAEQSAIASTEAAELARVRAEEQSRRVTEQKAAAAAEETRRRETIANLTSQAQLLGRQRKYKEALAVIKQIKVIDPDNAYAISAEPLIWDAKQLQEQRQAVEAMDRAVVDVFNQAEAARVPIPEILSYPDDWPDISVRRDRTVAMERGGSIDAQTEALLDSVLPEMRFDQTAFQDVVEYLRDTTQANIFVNWNVLEAAGIDKMTQIDTRLRNIKFRKVLEIILRSADLAGVGLGYTIDDGVITISTSEDLARNTKTFTYDIRDLLVSIPTFDNAPEFNLDTGGGQGGGGSPFGGGGGGNNPDDGEADELIEQIITLITETIATDSWKDNGGLVGSIQELGGQLIITQTPENHGLITDLLRKLRETRAIQVNVEARFVTVQRNFLEEVGVDFDFQFNVDYGNFPGSGFNPNSSFSPVLVSQNLVNNDANSAARGFTSAGALISGGPGNLGQEAASNNYGTTAGISAFLDDFRASLLLRAVQLGQYTSTLTAPRITLFNGQRGWVIVSTQQSYVSDLEVVSSSGAIGFDPQVETINTGVVLDVQATVSADRKYVTLTLRPSLSRLIALRQFQVAQATAGGATGGGGGDGGQAGVALGFIQQPEIELTQLQTTVSVPDRGTLLLGGQTVSGVIERESGVPVLSKIPFLKRLFTNRGSSKDESVLLILVKPTIIIQREIEAEAYPNLQQ